jgi:hypothetical protein
MLVASLEVTKDWPVPQLAPATAESVKADIDLLDRALELGAPILNPDQFVQWEQLVYNLKERVSHRADGTDKLRKEEWRQRNRVLGKRQEAPDPTLSEEPYTRPVLPVPSGSPLSTEPPTLAEADGGNS